jgi:hypothetical protein
MQERPLHQPNDHLFKSVFSSPMNAAGLLKNHLPPQLSELINAESVTVENPSFLDPSFSSWESDLFLKVGFSESDAYLFVLLEHQSSPDLRLPLRILGYILRVWERFARESPGASRLPPVFPFLIAQTDRPWSTPTSLSELIDLPKGVEELLHHHQPHLRIHTLDLFTIPYGSLGGTPDGQLALRALKAKPVQALLSDEVWNACESEGVSADALTSFLLYTLDAVQDYESVLKRAKHSKSKPMNTESMSALQKLIHEGFAKGLLAGRRAAYREAVLDVLSVRFGEVPQAMKEHFESGCYDDELDRIRGLAKSAKSLQEFWQIARK